MTELGQTRPTQGRLPGRARALSQGTWDCDGHDGPMKSIYSRRSNYSERLRALAPVPNCEVVIFMIPPPKTSKPAIKLVPQVSTLPPNQHHHFYNKPVPACLLPSESRRTPRALVPPTTHTRSGQTTTTSRCSSFLPCLVALLLHSKPAETKPNTKDD